jgi:predicted phage terminase large subunit-like protein
LSTALIDRIPQLLPFMTEEEKVTAYNLLALRVRAEVPTAYELENNLALFVREAWKQINPGRQFKWSWHYDLICEYLTLVYERKIRRLILNVPPRSAKTTFATICFPCWVWAKEPSHEFLCACHSRDLATDFSVARRNLVLSQWYQELWGKKFQLSEDRNLAIQFNNDRQGRMIATSTGSGAEGKGGDTAILDDPMSSEQSLSDSERYTANRWVNNTLKQRLNDPSNAAIIVIMQRLHEMDTTGFITSEDPPGTWTHLVLPLVAEKDEEWVFPISGRMVTRKKGEVLQPDRFTPDVVEEKQRNRLVFAGQYQQRPAPLEGNMIKRVDIMYYGGKDPLTGEADEPLPAVGGVANPVFDRTFITVDAAFKDLKTCDYVAIGVISTRKRKRFVRNVVNAHLDLDGTVKEIRNQRKLYPEAQAIIVEDKANGPAVVQALKKDLTGVIEIEPQGGKVARVFAVAPEWQAHDWYVDRNAAWAEPFVQQLTMFPTAAHDDMVDMMSQAGIWLGGNTSLNDWNNL